MNDCITGISLYCALYQTILHYNVDDTRIPEIGH